MNLYYQLIMPRLLDWSMSDGTFSDYRQQVLAQVSGETLEIGFGTGLNLPYYPKHIKKLITVDANPGMNAIALKRIQTSDIVVEHNVLSGENLPFASESFDSVVTTWTLCSIANVEQALKEIYRVLKPQGRYFFIEHGLSNDAKVQVWQNRLTPIQKVIGDGCHLNRDIKHLVENHFSHLTIEQFYSDNLPKILGYLYKGVAVKG